MLSFTAAGYAYLDFYLPLLRDAEFPRESWLAPWHQEFFTAQADDLFNSQEQEKQKDLERFFRDFYFPWIKDLLEADKNRLFDKNRFIDQGKLSFTTDGLARLLPDAKYRLSNAYNLLWEILCSRKDSPLGHASEKLAGLLYQGAHKFTQAAFLGKKEID